MKRKHLLLVLVFLLVIGPLLVLGFKRCNFNLSCSVGDRLDSLNGVVVYYNGGVGQVSGRNVTADNYNLGLKYQCVEFVKRYYYEHLHHKMPDTYGNAKDFFNPHLTDGQRNKQRDLLQYTNGSKSRPQVNDLIVFNDTYLNEYGHVAIISGIDEDEVEIIQQNSGSFGNTRESFDLVQEDGLWRIEDDHLLGWLRKSGN